MLSATILVFGLVYMIGYSLLYKGEYRITPGSLAGGVLQHVRSYGLLLIFASVRKFYTLQLQSEREKLEAQIAHLKSRSAEHTSELQSLMRISYAVFCLTKKKTHTP